MTSASAGTARLLPLHPQQRTRVEGTSAMALCANEPTPRPAPHLLLDRKILVTPRAQLGQLIWLRPAGGRKMNST
jgi:hypothetical protein